MMETSKGSPVAFSPPLYRQRYMKVLSILTKLKPKKVIDLGCAECKFLQLATKESYIEELCGVDINGELLQSSCHRVQPMVSDYLHPRSNMLNVQLFQGSVFELDTRLEGFDAVLCIELLEHLAPTALSTFSSVVFGGMQPKYVVITTPNADFNVLFDLNGKLRHMDHKFEWSQHQFKVWCNLVSAKYGYSYNLDGVGVCAESQNLGPCSQIAVFQATSRTATSLVGASLFTSLFQIEFPHKTVLQVYEERLLREWMECLESIVTACCSWPGRNNDSHEWTTCFQHELQPNLSSKNSCTLVLHHFDDGFAESKAGDSIYCSKNSFDPELAEEKDLTLYCSARQHQPEPGQPDDAVVPVEIMLSNGRGSVPVILSHKCKMSSRNSEKIFCSKKITVIPIQCLLTLRSFECGIRNVISISKSKSPEGVTFDKNDKSVTVDNTFFNKLHDYSFLNSAESSSCDEGSAVDLSSRTCEWTEECWDGCA